MTSRSTSPETAVQPKPQSASGASASPTVRPLPTARRMSRLGTETAFEVLVRARAVPMPLREERDFRLDVNELADLITDRTKLIVINTPHNPTGGMLSEQDVRDMISAIGDRNIMLLSDEIYSRLIFDGKHFSPI